MGEEYPDDRFSPFLGGRAGPEVSELILEMETCRIILLYEEELRLLLEFCL
jgi:hypothetical protein